MRDDTWAGMTAFGVWMIVVLLGLVTHALYSIYDFLTSGRDDDA